MVTSVWLFKPRSHGRKKEATRARNGAPLPGRLPSFRVPHRSASSALCPCGHAASFRRRVSSFVRGVRRLGVRRRCSGGGAMRARAVRAACRVACARAVLLCGLVAGAAAARVLRLSRRRARVAWRLRAWRLRGARAGCCGGVRLASCRRCGRRARGFPCSCARDVVDAAAGRRRRGHGHGPRGEWSVFMASLAARVAQQRAGRWWCWRGAGGRCRSWPQRGRRRPLRARRLSGRGSGRVR